MKVSSTINKDTIKDLNHIIYVVGLILTIIGAIGSLLYLILTIAFPKIQELEILIVFVIPLVFGVTYLIVVKNTIKKNKDLNTQLELELGTDSFIATEIKNGETIASVKVFYKDIVKVKETKINYYLYPNYVSAYPVKKDALTEEELEVLKQNVAFCRMKAKSKTTQTNIPSTQNKIQTNDKTENLTKETVSESKQEIVDKQD